ncbi:dynactin p62 [Meredithblackwellia eburnea MCA 4105]
MSSAVLFHCPCTRPLSFKVPPPSQPPLSSFHHQPLSSLLFCEECDAIRCDTCVSCEIACYYCPNCLFEVPSASVRGEKNRCARNCFQCPQCTHTLSVVATDPSDRSIPLHTPAASVGEPPYYLSCAYCRWDSKEVGITFDKPTGLAHQLQKTEEGAPELAEFDHVKEHLEPFLKRSQAHAPQSTAVSQTHSAHPAASAALLKDIPGLGARYGSLFGLSSRARGAEGKSGRDELEKYEALGAAKGGKGKGKALEGKMDQEVEKVDKMRNLKDAEDIARLDTRWTSSWNQPLLSSELKPVRTPLQSKRSKRCPSCKSILIKPEQKSSSTRFKIKLVASNYLPSIDLYRRPPQTIGSRLSAIGAGTASGMRRTTRTGAGRSDAGGGVEDEPLRPGRTYTFELGFTNPLYDPIHVKLAVARPSNVGESPTPPYAVNLPAPSFPISAYAEEWEYEDDEDGGGEGEDDEEGGLGSSPSKKRRSRFAPGIVERKMNRTTITMDVNIAKDTLGPVRANMLVTYVYQSDDGGAPPSPTKSPMKKGSGSGGGEKDDVKTFSFWTLLTLGTVMPRAEPRRSMAASTSSG